MTANECCVVLMELGELYTVPEALRWLQSPHPQLNDRMPIDCTLGEVLVVVMQLKDGAFT